MINRLKAHLRVYGRHIEVISVLVAMVLSGWIGGYMMRGAEMADVIASIRAAHAADIDRIQATHKENVSAIAGRLDEISVRLDSLVDRQAMAVDEVGEAARTAKQAASTARGAATSAARAAIKETVIIEVEPKEPEKQDPPEWLLNGG